jgi:hypothetical protein
MTLKSRLLALVLMVTLTGTLVAAEPAKPTPEQAVAARRIVIRNGNSLSVNYRTDDLNPLDAVAYKRLEFIENKVELNHDLQGLARLQVQNNVQAELYHVRALASFTPSAYGAACYDTTDVALQNLFQLDQAYQEVLNIERLRQGLEPMAPAVPAAAAPVPATAPVVVTVVAPPVPVAVAPAARTPVAPAAPATVNPAQMAANLIAVARLINAPGPVAAAPVTPSPAPETPGPQMHVTGTTPATPVATPATAASVAVFAGVATALRGLLAIGSLALLFIVR